MFATFLKATAPTLALLLSFSFAAQGQTTTGTQTKGDPAKAKTKTKAAPTAAKKLDLNRATAEEMTQTLPGVGEVTARKIIAGRPYATFEDVAKAGVPVRTLEAIRPLVTVSSPAAPKAKAMPKESEKAKAALTPSAPTSGAKVRLNTATSAQLQELPGVGPALAAAIIAGRPFRSVNDLEQVKGLGEAKINTLRPLVTVADAAPPVATRPAVVPPVATTPGPAMPRTATPPAPATKGAVVARKKAAEPKAQLAPGQVVNINTAPKEELDLLPGIGPVKAQAIVEGRPFKTKEDVMKVKGIKEGEFARIKDIIRVD